MNTLIYVLQDIRGDVRYVGKTWVSLYKRFHGHITEAKAGLRKTHKNNWINSCIKQGYLPLIRIIDGPIDGDGCLEERYWIARYRREGADLTNATDGGEGRNGCKATEETKLKMSIAHKGRKPSKECLEMSRSIRLGSKATLETRTKQSVAKKGKKRGPLPLWVRQKIAASHIGIRPTRESIERRAVKLRGRTLSKEHKQKIGKGLLSAYSEGRRQT